MPTDPAGHLVLWLVTRPEHKVRSPPIADIQNVRFQEPEDVRLPLISAPWGPA